MIKIDLTAIHRLMTRYYGSRKMNVDTNVEEKHFIRPSDMKMIFDYEPSCDVDFLTLLRRLKRYMRGTDFILSINKEENKIQIHVLMYDKPKYKDFDFEFSSN